MTNMWNNLIDNRLKELDRNIFDPTFQSPSHGEFNDLIKYAVWFGQDNKIPEILRVKKKVYRGLFEWGLYFFEDYPELHISVNLEPEDGLSPFDFYIQEDYDPTDDRDIETLLIAYKFFRGLSRDYGYQETVYPLEKVFKISKEVLSKFSEEWYTSILGDALAEIQ